MKEKIVKWVCCKCKKEFEFNKRTLTGDFPASCDPFNNNFDVCEKCIKEGKNEKKMDL